MTRAHATTEGMDIQIGRVYSYVNETNYVTILKVTRVTEKSVFVLRWLRNGEIGEWSKDEYREGVTNFKKYTLQKDTF